MEVKKTKKADLENTKSSSYLMGLVVGLAILFVGFEWGSQEVKAAVDTGIVEIQEEEQVEITRQDEPPPPPPPAPQQVVAEIINIVDDNVKLEQQEIVSSEDNSKAAQVQTYVPPAVANNDDEEASQEVFAIVEEMPSFPGGDTEMMKFLNGNIKYPVIAQENGVSGRVIIQFVVNKDGSIVEAAVVRGVDPSLDKEALRVVNSMPKWTPGKQRGKPVRVRYTVPVTFKLQ
ncbi:MAG: energy transducer TonB [Tannerellaceae bacterium]|nr:energy transducer TonB [Tannerellaceae bacterium]